jgi:hypothetical protein
MVQHQYDTESEFFDAPVDVATDFLFFLSEMLGEEKQAYYTNDEKSHVSVKLTHDEIERITDWIMDFNFSNRKPLGLPLPDIYLDEEEIRKTTVDVYSHTISKFILYMLEHQNLGRDNVAKWAAENFMLFYARAYSEALKAQATAM